MKKEKQNMEDWKKDIDWKLFELLEGELSAEEEAQLLAEIESDEELQAEWEGMQRAVAPTPQMSFPNKSALLRKERKIIPLWSFLSATPVRVAAAATIILFIAYPIWKFSTPQQGTGSLVDAIETPVTDEVMPQNDQNDASLVADTEVQNTTDQVEETIVPQESAPIINQTPNYNYPSDQIQVVSDDVTEDPEMITNDEELMDLRVAPISAPVRFASSQSRSEAPMRLYKTESRQLDRRAERAMYDQYDDYNGIRPMIDKGLYALGTPFRNTVVKVNRTDYEKSTLIMAYVGQRYQAMAMLELK